MAVSVPANVVQYIRQASDGTGIGYGIVACQVNEESGFDAGAVSPAGAEGPYQFLPSTFYSYGSGSPFNWEDSTRAYINFMNALSRQFGGDIFQMLAAYNAGPGNIAAGYGYATTILRCAGAGTLVGRAQPLPSQGYDTPVPAPGNSDDWSGSIDRGGRELYFAGVNAFTAGEAIRRL